MREIFKTIRSKLFIYNVFMYSLLMTFVVYVNMIPAMLPFWAGLISFGFLGSSFYLIKQKHTDI